MKYISDVYKNRRLLLSLSKNEFKQRYFGNNLGIAWAFIQPVATILILWFVFQVGFKATPIDDVPFILWLVAGMIPWFYFTDALSSGVNSVLGNTFLVKKVVFNVGLLPIISILSVLVIHLFFISFLFLMFTLYGYGVSIYWTQIIYYVFASSVLLLGISWFTSSVVLFFRDIGQIVGLVIQFGFWLTPIFWTLKMVPEKYIILIKLNPVIYIIDGFRNSLIYHKWFWEDYTMTLYFWFVTIVICFFGSRTFNKLRPHFADVV